MTAIDRATHDAALAFVAELAERYDIKAALLFGSRARNDHRPDSDADVAVLLRGEAKPIIATSLDMVDAALDTGIVISPFPIWENQWEHPETYANPDLVRNIKPEGLRCDAFSLSRES